MKKCILAVAGFLLCSAVLADDTAPSPAQLARLGAAHAAKTVCSGVFLSGRGLEDIYSNDMIGSPIPMSVIQVDRDNRTVTVDLGTVSQTAVLRDNCGCTVARDMTVEELRAQPVGSPFTRPELPADIVWPLGKSDERTPGDVDMTALETAIDHAFEVKAGTRGFVVVHDGKLVTERYTDGYHKDMPLTSWSMTKTITACLVGILSKDGKLNIHAPAAVPEWTSAGDKRGTITLDQLLRMSSGLKFEEEYGIVVSDVVRMLYDSSDAAAFAANMPLKKDPDTRWSYSSGTTNIISRIVRDAVGGGQEDYYRFVRERLLDPLGMTSATIEADASGTLVGSSFMYCTPRDWARFGQFLLQDGVWEGDQILPEGWVKYMSTPTPKAKKGNYGAQTWLNVGPHANPEKRVLPDAPTDLIYLSGFNGQRVFVVPSHSAVIVRMGLTPASEEYPWNDVLARLLAAIPQR